MRAADEILAYWFGAANRTEPSSADLDDCITRWFESGTRLDAEIASRFAGNLEDAAVGANDSWAETPRGLLALIVVLDQFSRNIHRGSPQAFGHDATTLALAQRAIERGDEAILNAIHRIVLYLPLMHSEELAVQRLSLASYHRLHDDCGAELRVPMTKVRRAAERHFEIIERFGRFPHRNKTLGRTMTAAETAFLNEPNSSF